MTVEKTKLIAGQYMVPVTLTYVEGTIEFQFPFNRDLLEEVKVMAGAKWLGYEPTNPRKVWRVKDCPRNRFQLDYLKGKNPYKAFDAPVTANSYTRPLYEHQKVITDFILARRQCVIAAEMGCGKSLSAIEAMERSEFTDWWWVGPHSALMAAYREFRIWQSKIVPRTFTYEKLTQTVKEWSQGLPPPRGLICDESSRVKNPTAQRSQAVAWLADLMRENWGSSAFIVLMSGSPAPKSPCDWYSQCEIACPGFLREGTYEKFKRRLGIIVEKESLAGGKYPHLESWLDDARKCQVCGKLKDDPIHDAKYASVTDDEFHAWKPSKNEVSNLYNRMQGLVIVKLKKECLDLPDKIYREINLEPSRKTINIAKTLVKKAATTIEALTLLRELSDGFQYVDAPDGEEKCRACFGRGVVSNPLHATWQGWVDHVMNGGEVPADFNIDLKTQPPTEIPCDVCKGSGVVPRIVRTTRDIETPKTDAIIDLLDEFSECGRTIFYASFTGSIDKVVEICRQHDWHVIRVDGRGPWCSIEGETDILSVFQDKVTKFPRVAFVGHPQSGGMGLTLTASPMICYYSSTFNGEDRIQSEDRAHRPGMDLNRGCTIIDLFHLPTDRLVFDNVKAKRALQGLTLGEINSCLGKE